MRNLHIPGGRDVGAPKDWDEAKSGRCLTISVLTQTLPDGGRRHTTAWQFDAAELAKLAGEGGAFLLSFDQPFIPVMQLYVVGDGEPSILTSEADERVRDTLARDAATRAAILHIVDRLDQRVSEKPIGMDAWKGKETHELLQAAMMMATEIPRFHVFEPSERQRIVNLPVIKMEDVRRVGTIGREAPGTPWGYPAETVRASADRFARFLRHGVSDADQPRQTSGRPRLDEQAAVYAADYVKSTEGADYEPTDWERELIADALAGFVSECCGDLQPVDRTQYKAGPLTMEHVFRPARIENLSDMQAVLDSVEGVLQMHEREIPVAILSFLDAFAGQENTAEEVRDFVQLAARFYSEGRKWQEWRDHDLLCAFAEWLDNITGKGEPYTPPLPSDVRALVIAARKFWDDNHGDTAECRELDKALEAFASRVPYENEPEDE